MIPAFLNTQARDPDNVERALVQAGLDVRRVSPVGITQAVAAAVKAGAMRVVAAGGDGTVSSAAAAVADTGAELAVVPAGTFNHFARDHGLPVQLEAACALAVRGESIRPVDVAWVNDRLFLNTSSVGVYANFVKGRDKWEPRFGYWMATALSMVRNLVRIRPFTIWFEADVLERVYHTPLVFIGVGERELKLPTLGNRVAQGRAGLHVLIVRGSTRARLVALAFAAAARGVRAVSRTPHLDSMLVTRCRIEQRHSTVAVDGEIVRLESPLEYRLGTGALRLVVPDRSNSSDASTI